MSTGLCWPGMTVPNRRAKPCPHAVVRGTRINTYIAGGMSVVMPLNRQKKVAGLPGHKSHVHKVRGADPKHLFSKVKAHGAIERGLLLAHAERLRVLSLEIDRIPDDDPRYEEWLDEDMARYVELVSKLSERQLLKQIELERARGVVRCSIVVRQLKVQHDPSLSTGVG